MFTVKPVRYLPPDEFAAAKRENEANHSMCRIVGFPGGPPVCHGYHCHRCGAGVGMMGHGDACRIKPADALKENES